MTATSPSPQTQWQDHQEYFAIGLKGKSIGDFKLTRIFHKGLSRTVYIAKHRLLKHRYLISFFSSVVLDMGFSFEQCNHHNEVISSLGVRNLRPIIETQPYSNGFYTVAEYFPGIPLDRIIRLYQHINHPPTLSEIHRMLDPLFLFNPNHLKTKYRDYNDFVCQIILKISVAIEKAHRAGIVHGCLNPINVWITREGEPMINQFGMPAKPHPKLMGRYMSSAFYLAPELL